MFALFGCILLLQPYQCLLWVFYIELNLLYRVELHGLYGRWIITIRLRGFGE